MKKIIKLNETDLVRIVKRVLNEKENPSSPEMPETPPSEYLDLVSSDNTEKSSSLYDNDISKDKNCFVNAKKVPTTHGKPGREFDFPTKCEKGFSDECVETMFGEITKFMGDRQKNSSLGNCLLKISSLKPKLWKHMEGMS